MTGLLYKDILVMRATFIIQAVIMPFYIVLAYFDNLNFVFIITYFNTMLMVMPLSAFALDGQAKWDRYAMSLPMGRRAVVRARYLFILILALSNFALGLSGSAALWVFQGEDILKALGLLMASSTLGLLVSGALLPISYQSGAERARIALYAILLIPFFAILLLYTSGILDLSVLNSLDSLSAAALVGRGALLLLGGLAAMLASYLVSCRIAAAKEY